MSGDRGKRSWAAWARVGSIAMAALAVISLGATVITSQRALSDASDVVIRGEGDLLLAALVSDLADESNPTSSAALERVLDANASSGLRYVAIVDREGRIVAQAGVAAMSGGERRPGESRVEGSRARVTGLLSPPRRGGRGTGPRPERFGPALLVAELEPPVLHTLRGDLARI